VTRRLVFVLLDGLAATAKQCLGYLKALEEAGLAGHCELTSELPALSRPLYATLLCGLPPVQTGIVRNDAKMLCPIPTVFHQMRDAGLRTAAAAYYWISEICNHTPFDADHDRLTDNLEMPINHGLFYSSDAYPDDELFRDAEWLRLRHEPDMLFVHSMGIDYAGHAFGADSAAYRNAARNADALLARCLPRWFDAGYAALITSDHGMGDDGSHTDATEQTRQVPFWLAGDAWRSWPMPARQTEIAGLALNILGIGGKM
jgi:predicted AlkP superfamily pyrophosphatase or phosphodiesterase